MRVSIAKKVAKHRAKLRARGLRPVQIWVPDTRRPGFAREARRQSRMLRNDPQEREIMNWLEKVADRRGWK
jgi:Antitoxin MazE-like